MNESTRPSRWLLLRGWGRQAGHWFDFPRQLGEALDASCEALDLPGAGERRREPAPLSIADTAAAVEARLRAARPGESTGILALSLGAMVALELCARARLKVARLVLVNGSSRLSPPRERLRPGALPSLLAALAHHNPIEREKRIYSLVTNLAPEAVQSLAERSARLSGERPNAPGTVLRQLVAAARFEPPRPQVATLVLRGDGDRLVSPRCSERLAEHLGAPLRAHPTAGHDLPAEDPSWILERLVAWL